MMHPSKKEYTLKNSLWFAAFIAAVIIGLVFITGCEGEQGLTSKELVAEAQKCEDPINASRLIRSRNGVITGVQCTPIPVQVVSEFKPNIREFTLDDGTRCVMVATRSPGRVRIAGPDIPGQGGVSCDWTTKEIK